MNENIWNNRERKQQVINFTGLARGKLMPCDLDACAEWRNRGYVLIEVKYKDAPMPYGQKLMYIRMADDLDRAGKPTMLIVAEHQQTDCDRDVDLANCRVRSYYFQGMEVTGWHGTVKELYDNFINELERRRNGR